jgi:hypothetical protein
LVFSSGCSIEGTIMVDVRMDVDVEEATISGEKG